MKLRHLPKIAIIALAVGALLALSGGAYAVYQLLWPKPEVHVTQPTTSESGRQQFTISSEQCGAGKFASQYELKKNAPITIEEVPKVLEARCEINAINTWASNSFPHDDPRGDFITDREYDSIQLSPAQATHIKSISNGSITFVGLTKYNQEDKTFAITEKTRFIADGRDVEMGSMTSKDPVMYITSEVYHMVPSPDCDDKHCTIQNTPVSNDLVAVVKLALPFEYYDQLAWQSLVEKRECLNNDQEICLLGSIGGIELYQDWDGPYPDDKNGLISRSIQGVITKIEGASVTLRASSGALYVVNTPGDIIGDHNRNKMKYYDNQKVEIGNSLRVSYTEKSDQKSKIITSDSLENVSLLLETGKKGEKWEAY